MPPEPNLIQQALDQNPPPATPPPSDLPSTSVKPDFLPDEYWDAASGGPKIKELYQRMSDSQTALRHKQDEMRSAIQAELLAGRPATPDEYAVAPETLVLDGDKRIPISDDDPVLKSMRSAAHELGLSQEKWNFLVRQYGIAMVDAMPDVQKELRGLGERATERVSAVVEKAKARLGEGALPVLMQMVHTAAHVELMERLLTPAAPGAALFDGGGSMLEDAKIELDKLMASDDYWKRDTATLKKVEQLWGKVGRGGR